MVTPPQTAAATRHTRPADSNAAVDALMATLSHPHLDAIHVLRRAILAVDPAVAEGVKWNAPSFRTHEYFATVHLRTRTGIALILHLGARAHAPSAAALAIEDPEGLLRWLAPDRAQVLLADGGELRAQLPALQQLLRQWIRHV